ncbi:sugar porter (SP) family MFS transporter [Kushneria sinocarnis]|uniref:Sugar porter (SP) family MFS transporter n=1 Tax=Kushneria sinocarnis TaxID=595502 RepID=A0A420X0U1_9GAMM|nr:sugar porter family MFS transporter [Kushneria sinocarnis]RKR07367.1 sugar porter (SP) family MFS transporter [Kushneria sinocarnis]
MTDRGNALAAHHFVLVIACVAAIAGFLYGYDTGIISGALLQIGQEFSLGHFGKELITSAILAGAVIGALGCAALSRRLGRRMTIMIVAAVFACGAVAAALSPGAVWLGLFRLVLGFAVGGATQVVPTYIAELAPAERRGRLVTWFNVSIGVGILAAALVGSFLQQLWSWRMMIGIGVVPSTLLLLGMLVLPESPRWLIRQRRREEARAALARVRGEDEDIGREIEAIESLENGGDEAPGWQALRRRWLRPALVAGLGIAAFTQLSGIEMMIYYTPTFLTDAGFGDHAALYSALGVAIVYLVMTVLGKLLVDRLGRRRLTLWMMPGSALSLFVLGGVFALGAQGATSWLIVAGILVYMIFNAGGIQVVGWLIGSEVYPLAIRERATSLHAATLWGANLILTGTALTMVRTLGTGGAMWVYAVLNVLCFLFVLRYVPETKGRSLEDIERSLREGRFRPGA